MSNIIHTLKDKLTHHHGATNEHHGTEGHSHHNEPVVGHNAVPITGDTDHTTASPLARDVHQPQEITTEHRNTYSPHTLGTGHSAHAKVNHCMRQHNPIVSQFSLPDYQ